MQVPQHPYAEAFGGEGVIDLRIIDTGNPAQGTVRAIVTKKQFETLEYVLRIKLNDIIAVAFYPEGDDRIVGCNLALKGRQAVEQGVLRLEQALSDDEKYAFSLANNAKAFGVNPVDAERIITYLAERPAAKLKVPEQRMADIIAALRTLAAMDVAEMKKMLVDANGMPLGGSQDDEEMVVVGEDGGDAEVQAVVGSGLEGAVNAGVATKGLEMVQIPGVPFELTFAQEDRIWDFSRLYDDIQAAAGETSNAQSRLEFLSRQNNMLKGAITTRFQFHNNENVHWAGNTKQLLEFLGYLETRYPAIAGPAMDYIRTNFARFHVGDQTMHDDLDANAMKDDTFREAVRADFRSGVFSTPFDDMPMPKYNTTCGAPPVGGGGGDAMEVECDACIDPMSFSDKLERQIKLMTDAADKLPKSMLDYFGKAVIQSNDAILSARGQTQCAAAPAGSTAQKGWLYATISADNPTRTKIGVTERPRVNDRTKSYNTTSVNPWVTVARIAVVDCQSLEKWIHTELEALGRRHGKTELFSLDEPSAVLLFNMLHNTVDIDGVVDYRTLRLSEQLKSELQPPVAAVVSSGPVRPMLSGP